MNNIKLRTIIAFGALIALTIFITICSVTKAMNTPDTVGNNIPGTGSIELCIIGIVTIVVVEIIQIIAITIYLKKSNPKQDDDL